MTELRSTTLDSPVGTLRIVASDAGLRAVLWPDDSDKRVPLGDVTDGGSCDQRVDAVSSDVLAAACEQLVEYFAGTRQEFDLPLDANGTEFQQSAWKALTEIPYGQTVSYGEQAEQMGDKRKARAVGAANGRNPISIIVPCHRVVGSNGALTGFAGGIDVKEWLLTHERRVAGHTLDI